MTKKHFIALAGMIKNRNAQHERGQVDSNFDLFLIETLADFCQSQNPQFNRERWLSYIKGDCGSSGGKVKAVKSFGRSEFKPFKAVAHA